MTKLIKRGVSGDETSPQDTLPSLSLDAPSSRRGHVIDKDAFEARTEANIIRERARAQAEQIVSQAEADADRLIAEATQKAAQIQEDAYQKGLAEGQEAGSSQLSEAVAQASVRLSHIEAQAVPQLKELAVAIARRILGKELELHPEQVVSIVRHALGEKARQRTELFLRVHPDDFALLKAEKAALLEVLSRAKEIGIKEDPSIQRHGVVIETDAGTIDAQLDTQLAVFERILKDMP